MRLDIPTLFAITIVITLVVGLLFLLSWNQTRRTRALLLWGVSHLFGAAGSALTCLRFTIPDSLSIGLGNAALLAAYGFLWSGMRSFEGRSPTYAATFAGSAVWLAACLVPAFYASLPARIMLASALAGLYCALSAHECRRGHREALPSRWPAIVLMASYAMLYWARIPLTVLLPATPSERLLESPWLPILCLGAIAFSVSLAFLFMALTKERAEREQRIAAETDALTGVANRRAFVARAKGQLDRPEGSIALLLFDLDHFKSINDRFGHGVGDAVLTGFGHFAQALLPAQATLGRLGGEEFACIAPGIDAPEARRIAETLRTGLVRLSVAAYPELTVRTSIGVAIRPDGGTDTFDDLMRRADAALYRAKSRGRNRVEAADPTVGSRAA